LSDTLTITPSTPFTYAPANGNLLIDVMEVAVAMLVASFRTS
jgi:hypothetical protein